MNYNKTIHVKCPMCGFVNKLSPGVQQYLNIENEKPFVLTCDSDEGGCDRYFFVKIRLSEHVTTGTVNV